MAIVNVGGGGLKILPKPVEKTFVAFENISKNDALELSTGSSTTNGRVKKAIFNTELMRDITVTVAAQMGWILAEKLDETRFLVILRASSTGYPKAHIATIDPILGTYTIGAEVVIEATNGTLDGLALLSPTKAVAIYTSGGVARLRVLNISGSTIALGASVYTTGTSVDKLKGFMLSATKVILFYRVSGNNPCTIVATVAGDAVSFGTLQNWSAINTVDFRLLRISDSKAILMYMEITGSTTYTYKLRVVNISGTVVSLETTITPSDQAQNFKFLSEWLVKDETFLSVSNSSSNLMGRVITISGDTLIMGTNSSFSAGSNEPYLSLPFKEDCIILSRDGVSTQVALTVFSDSDKRIGRSLYSDSPTTQLSKVLLPLENNTFAQISSVGTGNSTILNVRFFKAIKYVGAIAKSDAVANDITTCLVL